MKKRTDQGPFGITLALFDHRSEAFRQKMLNHFQSKDGHRWTDIKIIPEKRKNGLVIFSKEST